MPYKYEGLIWMSELDKKSLDLVELTQEHVFYMILQHSRLTDPGPILLFVSLDAKSIYSMLCVQKSITAGKKQKFCPDTPEVQYAKVTVFP